jgi:HD superfamily phosphodiesterase
LKIPSRTVALQILEEAEVRNAGNWIKHSLHAAQAAEAIAQHHPALNADSAYILGCLHDIGRREGTTGMRHILDGYTYLNGLGYEDAARVCLTHSYPVQDVWAVSGKWDCTPDEMAFKVLPGIIENTFSLDSID